VKYNEHITMLMNKIRISNHKKENNITINPKKISSVANSGRNSPD